MIRLTKSYDVPLEQMMVYWFVSFVGDKSELGFEVEGVLTCVDGILEIVESLSVVDRITTLVVIGTGSSVTLVGPSTLLPSFPSNMVLLAIVKSVVCDPDNDSKLVNQSPWNFQLPLNRRNWLACCNST